jgi:hypothetical protein
MAAANTLAPARWRYSACGLMAASPALVELEPGSPQLGRVVAGLWRDQIAGGALSSSSLISRHKARHLLQMTASGPATRRSTSSALLPQKPQTAASSATTLSRVDEVRVG